jgi:hypothetical protein
MPSLPVILPERAWPSGAGVGDVSVLDSLTAGGGWGGPLIVSHPRSGSTLLGTILLLAGDSGGSPAFERYIHEPVAPVFWEGDSLEGVIALAGGRLTDRDVIQESAYQFASAEVASWFLRAARKPIAFIMRHPQLAWPSRWRIQMGEWLDEEPDAPWADRARAAVESGDYSMVGDLVTERVVAPDNGWLAFMDMIGTCRSEGIEFLIVDNARFREDPDGVLSTLCAAWGVSFHERMTAWQGLDEVIPRIVMSDLARESEFDGYYASTLGSRRGIVRRDRQPTPLHHFPAELRGDPGDRLGIEAAVAWYRALLEQPETI